MVAFAAGRLGAQQTRQPVGHSRAALHRGHARAASSSARAQHFSICARTPKSLRSCRCLPRSASWIGSIANQSRATLGGNLVNGSPAADSSPALLVYDAEIEMISKRGKPPHSLCRVPHRLQAQRDGRGRTALRGPSAAAIRAVTGSICARWERGAPWRFQRLRWPQLRFSRTAPSARFASLRQAWLPFQRGSIRTEAALLGQADSQRHNLSRATRIARRSASRSTTSAPPPNTGDAWPPTCLKNFCSNSPRRAVPR